jgi:hypothetical protein
MSPDAVRDRHLLSWKLPPKHSAVTFKSTCDAALLCLPPVVNIDTLPPSAQTEHSGDPTPPSMLPHRELLGKLGPRDWQVMCRAVWPHRDPPKTNGTASPSILASPPSQPTSSWGPPAHSVESHCPLPATVSPTCPLGTGQVLKC